MRAMQQSTHAGHEETKRLRQINAAVCAQTAGATWP